MMSTNDQAGGRKYLTGDEHMRFLLAANREAAFRAQFGEPEARL